MPVANINRTVLEIEAFVNQHMVPLMDESGRRMFNQQWSAALESGGGAEQLMGAAVSSVFLNMRADRLPQQVTERPPEHVRTWIRQNVASSGCTSCGSGIGEMCPGCTLSRAAATQERVQNVLNNLGTLDLTDAGDQAAERLVEVVGTTLRVGPRRQGRWARITADDRDWACQYCQYVVASGCVEGADCHDCADDLRRHEDGCVDNPNNTRCDSCGERRGSDQVSQCIDCGSYTCTDDSYCECSCGPGEYEEEEGDGPY